MKRTTRVLTAAALTAALTLGGAAAANAAGGAPATQKSCSPAGICWSLNPPNKCYTDGRTHAETHGNRVYYYQYYGYWRYVTVRPGVIKLARYFTVSVPNIPTASLLTLGSVYQYC